MMPPSLPMPRGAVPRSLSMPRSLGAPTAPLGGWSAATPLTSSAGLLSIGSAASAGSLPAAAVLRPEHGFQFRPAGEHGAPASRPIVAAPGAVDATRASMRPSLERALRHVEAHAGGGVGSNAVPQSSQGAALPPASAQPPSSGRHAPVQAPAEAVARGRQAIYRKMQAPAYGVGNSRPWSAQLENCEAQCRREVESIAASCRAMGQKFTDNDFPPADKALFVNGQRPSSAKMPATVNWVRAGDLSRGGDAPTLEVNEDSRLRPGAIDDTAFLGAVAVLRAAQRAPDDLIVHYDLGVGVAGIRLFKDSEWVYEIVDDHLPCAGDGLACGRTVARGEVWIGLLQKANAKIHGSYEAVQRSTEQEALEDLTSGAVRKLDKREVTSGEHLVHYLESRQRLGCLHLVLRRNERRGEEHECGLLAGHGYPVLEVEDASRCRLDNPWPRGGYRGSGGEDSVRHASEAAGPGHFHMDADELLRHFTDVLEVRLPPATWPSYTVTLSTERPSYPLISARQVTQCVVVASQPDRRWSRQDSYLNGLGIRAYRCRVRAPPEGQEGVRQDPSANPFEPLELVRRRPLGKTRSVSLDLVLEPYALYIFTVDSQYRCPRCVLRFGCSSDVTLRELSAQEAGHFLRAQPNAEQSPDAGHGLLRSSSEYSTSSDYQSYEEVCSGSAIARRCMCESGFREHRESARSWWRFGC